MSNLARFLPLLFAAVLLAAVFSGPGCCSPAGQLTASEIEPLVGTVTGDLERYLDAGIAPDGSELTPEMELQLRGPAVILRNAVHTALEEPREPLPELPAPVAVPQDG